MSRRIEYTLRITISRPCPWSEGATREQAEMLLRNEVEAIAAEHDCDPDDVDYHLGAVALPPMPPATLTWATPCDGKDSPWSTNGHVLVRRGCGAPPVSLDAEWARTERTDVGDSLAPLLDVRPPRWDDPLLDRAYAPLLTMGDARPALAGGIGNIDVVVVEREGQVVAVIACARQDAKDPRFARLSTLLAERDKCAAAIASLVAP